MATAANKLPRESTQVSIHSTLNEIKSALNSRNTSLNSWTGNLANLTTGEKSSLVAAINYVNNAIAANQSAMSALSDIHATLDEACTSDNGAGVHNSLFGGRNLGADLTTAQIAAINDRTFKGLYVGSYWGKEITFSYLKSPDKGLSENNESTEGDDTTETVTGYIEMVILDCDYYRNVGDNTGLTRGHIVVAPKVILYNNPMNKAHATTEGGYVGSDMYTKYLDGAKNAFNAFFGAAHILSHRDYLVNAVSDGKPSGGAWFDSTVELMDERQVYGSLIFDSGNPDGSTVPNRYSTGCKQFNYFRHTQHLTAHTIEGLTNTNRGDAFWWSRNVASDIHFTGFIGGGYCSHHTANRMYGVRPYALIY